MKEYVVTFSEGEALTVKAEFVDANSVAFVFTNASGTIAVIPNNGRVLHIVLKEEAAPVVEPEPVAEEPAAEEPQPPVSEEPIAEAPAEPEEPQGEVFE